MFFQKCQTNWQKTAIQLRCSYPSHFFLQFSSPSITHELTALSLLKPWKVGFPTHRKISFILSRPHPSNFMKRCVFQFFRGRRMAGLAFVAHSRFMHVFSIRPDLHMVIGSLSAIRARYFVINGKRFPSF